MTDHGKSFSRNSAGFPPTGTKSNTLPADASNKAQRSPAETERASDRGTHLAVAAAPVAGNPMLATVLGAGMSIGFYGLLLSAMRIEPVSAYTGPLERYFLGHPVAVAATILFCFALSMLIAKTLGVMAQNNLLDRIRDADLRPADQSGDSPAQAWLDENDAGHVARNWLEDLSRLPGASRTSHLVTRLQEVLTRQSQRGSTKHLADDLRELGGRDADAAHDSLGLVRIIVWAIPMLGFLGTVIGITQTLGGLDFSSGTGAVDNLKSGLYVAFDTTAMGLVLSVLAIFLQFPVERAEQRMLATIDARVGHLVSSTLPSDEASDNQTVLIADLCRGVQAAVAESLSNQATLWRETIDSAQSQWQLVHEKNNTTLADAFELTIAPALLKHAESINETSQAASERMSLQCDRWQSSLDTAQSQLNQTQQTSAEQIRNQTSVLNETLDDVCETLASQQQTLAGHYSSINQTHDAIQRLTEATVSLQHQMATTRPTTDSQTDGMADAMRILARAVDTLSGRMNQDASHSTRRAA
ncbi:MotA/TolQ/ExbB proton channel family protein [Rubripirellula lacrimiformis]|uniref:MotA/TolQ/ExbB proton channel family protein n=1 Tax=Rubripirellula lacrimiformis TaxID=1930273 RepID=A0A517N5S6_9BACT|nr:MotA/TolQ/ExbB proton channel family protein [Rubripirellula lacrimiformis]QDT02474.1 MotA/TolQ/ExbB proton channel family protein [Rubripirellula lacrimiformis]